MAFQLSTGLRNAMLGTGSLSSIMNLGFIFLYAGTVPANADAALTGTQVTKISNNSTATGLTLDTPAAGSIPKKASEVWSGVNGSSATVTHFRWVAAGDTGALSTTEPRIQGLIGTVGSDMNLSSVSLTASATQTIDTFAWTLPTF